MFLLVAVVFFIASVLTDNSTSSAVYVVGSSVMFALSIIRDNILELKDR